MKAFFQVTRTYMSVLLGLTAITGYRLAGGSDVDWRVLAWLFLGQACIAAGGFAMNDVLDRKRDIGVASKPIATGLLAADSGAAISTSLLIIGLVISLHLSESLFALAALQTLVVWSYSSIKWWSGALANWITAALCASGFAYGAAMAHQVGLAWFPILLTAQIVFAREVVKDVLDLRPDSAADLPTIPHKHGLRMAHYIVSAALSSAIISCIVVVTQLPAVASLATGLMLLVLGLVCFLWLRPISRTELSVNHAGSFLHVSAGVFLISLGLFALWPV